MSALSEQAQQAAPAEQPNNAPAQQQQPAAEALIAGKFKSVDDLVKSYQELEKKLGAPKGDPLKPSGEVAADGLSISKPQTPAAEAVLTAAYTKRSKGEELSEADYQALAKAGVSKTVAEQFFEGRDAVVASSKTAVYSEVGTPEDYANMVKWAGANLSPAEIKAYNDIMTSGNQAQMRLAVAGLKSRYSANFGSEGVRLEGTHAPAFSGVKPYGSRAEWLKDTGNPRYRTDPTFRDEVQKRFTASKAAKAF
jgi:hypothetical protein